MTLDIAEPFDLLMEVTDSRRGCYTDLYPKSVESTSGGSPSGSQLEARKQALFQDLWDLWEEHRTDSRDEVPAKVMALLQAARFVRALPRTLPVPELAVDDDGDFGFEWRSAPTRVFSISVGSGSMLHYAGLFGQAQAHGCEPLSDPLPVPVLNGIKRALRVSD